MIITIFTQKTPAVSGLQFDAVFSDTLDATVDYTQYPVETGASGTDHGIIRPKVWTLTAGVSDYPVRFDFGVAAGIGANLTDNPLVNAGLGLLSGALNTGSDSRSATTLQSLIKLMNDRASFSIDAVDIQLQNVVITNITRTNDASNESALVFTATMQELQTLDTFFSKTSTQLDQLSDSDISKIQAAPDVDFGEVSAIDL